MLNETPDHQAHHTATSGDRAADKFAWIKAASGDTRFTPAERYVLVSMPLWWVLGPTGTTFQVKQTTIADRLAVSERLVRLALTKARNHGWLVLDPERRRGRGNHHADTYRLNTPTKIPAHHAGSDDEIPARNVRNTGTDCTKYRHETSEIPARTNSLTSENDVPTVLSNGFENGFERGHGTAASEPLSVEVVPDHADALSPINPIDEKNNTTDAEPVDPDPDPGPLRYCTNHPNGTDQKCGGCKWRREEREKWEQRQAQKSLDAAAQTREFRWSCNTCRDTGVLLMSDGRPGTPPAWCKHNGGGRHVFTAEDQREHADLLARLSEGMTA